MCNISLAHFSDIAVEIVEDSSSVSVNNLLHEEKELIESSWSEARLKTYVMGRCAAHCAMRTLKKKNVPILKGEKGEPVWLSDMVGSISHKDAVAVAAVGEKKKYRGIGIDIEDCKIELSEKECSLFCTPEEMLRIEREENSPIEIFSLKEATLKAFYTAYGKLYNWTDIDIFRISKMFDVVTLYKFNKDNYIINLCCVKK